MAKRIFFKRHRMELDLRHPRPAAELPDGFYWLPWQGRLQDLHAQVKHQCFLGEMDAAVFPNLGTLGGCRDLMDAIVGRGDFCPRATWLVVATSGAARRTGPGGVPVCPGYEVGAGTVQGLLDAYRFGGIQNLGVVPEYRGLGLGIALLLKALEGFAAAGAKRAFLEVTAKNEPAVRMYRRLGFRNQKTIYREVEIEDPMSQPGAVDRELVGCVAE
jgi:GNAT superfamily N-acetyltransferase